MVPLPRYTSVVDEPLPPNQRLLLPGPAASTFGLVAEAFGVAVFIFIISFVLEKTILAHSAVFIHALPTFELDPDKWKGVGFGYARPPGGPVDIPLVGMILTEKGLVKDLSELFLAWTEGEFDDEAKNLRLSVVVISQREYVFMCYPNPQRPIAKEWFNQARQELRETSLVDVLIEHHGLFVLGKRCAILQTSYFPEFRRRLLPGTPVMFGFFLPPFTQVRFAPDTPTFVIHDFVIKDKADLTRQDLEYDAIGTFEVGGEWQGPSDLAL